MKRGRKQKAIPYNKVLALVRSGMGICAAIEKCGCYTTRFYNRLTQTQYETLFRAKAAQKKNGSPYFKLS